MTDLIASIIKQLQDGDVKKMTLLVKSKEMGKIDTRAGDYFMSELTLTIEEIICSRDFLDIDPLCCFSLAIVLAIRKASQDPASKCLDDVLRKVVDMAVLTFNAGLPWLKNENEDDQSDTAVIWRHTVWARDNYYSSLKWTDEAVEFFHEHLAADDHVLELFAGHAVLVNMFAKAFPKFKTKMDCTDQIAVVDRGVVESNACEAVCNSTAANVLLMCSPPPGEDAFMALLKTDLTRVHTVFYGGALDESCDFMFFTYLREHFPSRPG
jgi:hypothetical protein